MNVTGCSIKVRFLIIVFNTANLINEVATPTLSISHSLIAPVAIFTAYSFLVSFIIGALRNKYASYFLQMYALVACCLLEISLSFVVFKGLKSATHSKHAALVLNGILPMITIFLLLADLVVTTLSNRQGTLSSPSFQTHSQASTPDIPVIEDS